MISDCGMRIAECGFRKALGIGQEVSSQNPGGKNVEAVFPYWLLTTDYYTISP
jgi:hypothetical protein